MSKSTAGGYGRYEVDNPILPGFSSMNIDKLLKGIEKEAFGIPGKIIIEEDGVKLTKTTHIPEGKEYTKGILENKDYILGEVKYFESRISEKDRFKEQLLKKNKDVYELFHDTKRFIRKNKERNNPFKDFYNYLATFRNPSENF